MTRNTPPHAVSGLLAGFLGPILLPTAASAQDSSAAIAVDLADRSLGPIFHGGNGALYGLSEPNVPDINTLVPMKPSHILQKAPNGVQHPSGDALRVSDYFFGADGQNVQIYMQDYYGRWYYPARTGEEYVEEAVVPQAIDIKEYKDEYAATHPGVDVDQKFLYVPYNEPELSAGYPSLNYANGQYAGTHAYNNNVVERYAQMSVNGRRSRTVYFKNTISWQHFATMTLDVPLNPGRNTIEFTIDNSYDGGSNPYGGNNAEGSAGFTFLTMVPNQYTPAFDAFLVYELPSLAAGR